MNKSIRVLACLSIILLSASAPLSDASGVVGYGHGPDGPVVFVRDSNVILPAAATNRQIVVTGTLYRLDMMDIPEAPYIDRYRPAFPGASIGHHLVTAGTLAGLVYEGGNAYVLGNNHVIGNSDGGRVGDPVLQPGFYDGGQLATDIIARLSKWAPIARCNALDLYAGACPGNAIDAAIARLLDPGDVVDTDPPVGNMQAQLNQVVWLIGRSSGLVYGRTLYLAETVQVCCYSGNVAQFDHQIITNKIVVGGDSGSLLRDYFTGAAVGLMFAGSDTISIANPIESVLSELCVSFDPDFYCNRIYLPAVKLENVFEER